jgi:hypothetical protein
LENQVMLAETEFDEAIAVEETRLAELDRLSDAARTRLAELRMAHERATARDAEAEGATDAGATWSPERKVALFASLFRGREDVFPRRWEKPGKGRSGWAPRSGAAHWPKPRRIEPKSASSRNPASDLNHANLQVKPAQPAQPHSCFTRERSQVRNPPRPLEF